MDFPAIETKWQAKWSELGHVEPNDKPKFFMIFAYPGVSGYLHVGHMRGFSYVDSICRYKRLRGYNVLFPVGTHASGNQAIAFANKVRQKDEKWINYLISNGYPADKIAELENKDAVIKLFNTVYVEEYWKRFGFLCDWRRFTSTCFSDYEKFIQWQFKKLQKKNLLTQKSYFATFCPEHGPVAVDPSETDISQGGNAEKNEYTLLKFKWKNAFLVAATLRPETVYGQTNLWLNPEANYVRAQVGEETWILSKEAAHKLTLQKDGVTIGDDVSVAELFGSVVRAPQIERDIPILPSSFVNGDVGSGIVTSVPSDAPFDYVGLKQLQEYSEQLSQWSIDPSVVQSIQIIPIIKSKGFGDSAAKDIVEKMNITSLDQKEKLDEATKEIYKAGFHTGVLMDTCGDFAGKKVTEAKELMKQTMIASGEADVMYDLSEEVLCRCKKRVLVKRIDDQWFIRYSDDALTQKSKEHAHTMDVYPNEYKRNLPGTLDWFQDRACTRLGNWIGSKLPFDEKWIVEPISDSTLYPIYYLISKYVNAGELKTEQLTEKFFDYVYLGEGNASTVAQEVGITLDLLQQIRKDVEYWYPLDINLGGKEHQTVHFPVFVMNHVGILEERFWPKGIFVNYWVTGKGSKISKSKGGAEPIPGAIEKYGVDAMRLYYAHIGSAHTDVVWDADVVLNYKRTLERIFSLVEKLLNAEGGVNLHLDAWLESKLQSHLHEVTQTFDALDLREAATSIYFSFLEDLKWYQRRGGTNIALLKKVIGAWVQMMTPVTPHSAEELWNKLGHDNLVSASLWPEHDEGKVNLTAHANEGMIRAIINDVRTVQQLAKIEQPQKITLFIASEWKYQLYSTLKKQLGVTRNIGEILKHVMSDARMKEHAKSITKIVPSCLKDASKLPVLVTDQQSEYDTIASSVAFLEKEIGCKVLVHTADHAEHPKANSARPGKPAIVVE